MSDYAYTNVHTGEHYTDSELENIFQDYLDEIYSEVDIAGYTFSTGRALRELDYIAFREGFVNWLDSEITEGNYREYDPNSPECEECGEALSGDEVTVSLADAGYLLCEDCLDEDI